MVMKVATSPAPSVRNGTRALELAQRAVKVADSNDPVLWHIVSAAYAATGRYAEAEAASKKYLIKNPSAAGVRHQLAEVFASTGRYAEAISEFEHAATDAGKAPADKLASDLRRAEMIDRAAARLA